MYFLYLKYGIEYFWHATDMRRVSFASVIDYFYIKPIVNNVQIESGKLNNWVFPISGML